MNRLRCGNQLAIIIIHQRLLLRVQGSHFSHDPRVEAEQVFKSTLCNNLGNIVVGFETRRVNLASWHLGIRELYPRRRSGAQVVVLAQSSAVGALVGGRLVRCIIVHGRCDGRAQSVERWAGGRGCAGGDTAERRGGLAGAGDCGHGGAEVL